MSRDKVSFMIICLEVGLILLSFQDNSVNATTEPKVAYCNVDKCESWNNKPRSRVSRVNGRNYRSYPTFASCESNCPEQFYECSNEQCVQCGTNLDYSGCKDVESTYDAMFSCRFYCEKKTHYYCIRNMCVGFPEWIPKRNFGETQYSSETECNRDCKPLPDTDTESTKSGGNNKQPKGFEESDESEDMLKSNPDVALAFAQRHSRISLIRNQNSANLDAPTFSQQKRIRILQNTRNNR